MTILNIRCADAFLLIGKSNILDKKIFAEKRRDNAGKDKIVHLFLETEKSVV